MSYNGMASKCIYRCEWLGARWHDCAVVDTVTSQQDGSGFEWLFMSVLAHVIDW